MVKRLAILAVLPAIAWGQGGVVDGSVVNSVTRAGVAGVPVTLQRAASRDEEGHTGITDAAGNFRIEGLPDGEYIAGFGKPGFFPADLYGQGRGTLHVSAGNGPLHLNLALTPLPKLTGKVVDGGGQAVPDATVELVHVGGGGRPKTTSAKDGAFTFEDMLPGFFVLRAVPPPKLTPPKASEEEPAVWAPTYYPGVSEKFRAERITFGGRDVEGYDIKLVAAPAFHVRGVVVDDDGKPVAGAILQLICPDGLDERSHAPFDGPEARTTSADDGAFDLTGVRPGEWHLAARAKRGSQVLSAVVTGTVSKGDWDNVKVHVTAPFTVRGIVERPEPRGASGHHTWVGLIPAWQTRLMGIHDEGGVFEIDEVIPGKYQVLLEQPLPGSYVDRVEYGGRDVMGQTVDVTDSSLRLRVVYRTDGGRVQGTVENCSRGEVLLIPKEPALQNSELIRSGRCSAAGRFDIPSVRPGSYYAAAFDRTEEFAFYYGSVVDPALVARITERAAVVSVEAGKTATATLSVRAWPEK